MIRFYAATLVDTAKAKGNQKKKKEKRQKTVHPNPASSTTCNYQGALIVRHNDNTPAVASLVPNIQDHPIQDQSTPFRRNDNTPVFTPRAPTDLMKQRNYAQCTTHTSAAPTKEAPPISLLPKHDPQQLAPATNPERVSRPRYAVFPDSAQETTSTKKRKLETVAPSSPHSV